MVKHRRATAYITIAKIIGFDKANADRFLVLVGAENPSLELVPLDGGETERLVIDLTPEAKQMLAHIRGWRRVYGDTEVYVKIETKRDLRGRRKKWTNVFVSKNGEERKLSHCEQINCGQPSLSNDSKLVVYIGQQ